MSTTANYRDLASDSGVLLDIRGHREQAGRYTALALVFSNGAMILACDDETDELVVTVGAKVPDGLVPLDSNAGLDDLKGMVVETMWGMTNHRGYSDATQIRLLDIDSRDEQTLQFEVAASAMTIHRVEPV
jgi:hypothetical protein